jgi:hypothetical protein
MGGVLNFFGYFMIWLVVTKRIGKPSVWNMCLYICIGANSYTFTNTGAVVTSVKNFPESRGMVMGLNKGYISLSAANVNIEKLDFGSFKGYILRLLVNIAKYRLQKIRLWVL